MNKQINKQTNEQTNKGMNEQTTAIYFIALKQTNQ